MSMEGRYARFTAAELARALADEEWAREHVDLLEDGDQSRELSPTDRLLDLHKSWHALAYLLERAGAPVDAVLGGTVFAADEDWGYGPPRYFTSAEVAAAAAYLRATPYEALAVQLDVAGLNAAGIYPGPWDLDDVEWLTPWYDDLVRFFGWAADDGDALVTWIG